MKSSKNKPSPDGRVDESVNSASDQDEKQISSESDSATLEAAPQDASVAAETLSASLEKASDNDRTTSEMNIKPEILPPPPSEPSPPRPSGPSPKRGNGLALALAAFALIVSALAGWYAWEVSRRATAVEDRLATTLGQEKNDFSALVAQDLAPMQRQQETLSRRIGGQGEDIGNLKAQMKADGARVSTRLGTLEARLDQTENQAVALQKQYLDFARGREDRALNEVEQMVTIAAQQLQYAGNIQTALATLEAADARLAEMPAVQSGALKRVLRGDIERLRMRPHLDVNAEALNIDGVLMNVDALPLAYESRQGTEIELTFPGDDSTPIAGEDVPSEQDASAAGWMRHAADSTAAFAGGLFRDIWREVRGLIRVRRIDGGTESVLLAPEQSVFLRENLKLRLLTARLSLVARLEASYRRDIAHSREMLERYFDRSSNGVQSALKELERLENIPVAIQPIRLESLDALRAMRQQDGGGQGAPSGTLQEQEQVEVPALSDSETATPDQAEGD